MKDLIDNGFDLSEQEILDRKTYKKKVFRETELLLKQKVHVTDEVYKIIRGQKRAQKKSMARIVCELVLKNYKSKNK